ncbi:hypothetical protein M514_13228 [Trichuris suis]|uniref:Uncharacterized protein n=1 Tax=Trichuris suis TaxID=68888 RepID=A0A085MSA5_9BILA|nr:hypothetical protein M513_13228 [Trichuris suis]KFD60101.1 hypothetical protein M514_13228 [Trichuris suis]
MLTVHTGDGTPLHLVIAVHCEEVLLKQSATGLGMVELACKLPKSYSEDFIPCEPNLIIVN